MDTVLTIGLVVLLVGLTIVFLGLQSFCTAIRDGGCVAFVIGEILVLWG